MSSIPSSVSSEETALEAVAPAPPRVPSLLRSLARRPSVWCAVLWMLLVIVISALANYLGFQDPLAQDLSDPFSLPSWAHWLGTDKLGRDILSRLAHGGGELLVVALIPIGVSYVLGVPIGLYAGFVGGKVDSAASFVVNVLFSVPSTVIILAVAAATNNNLPMMTLVLGIFGCGGVIRLVRSSTVAAKNLLYVDAAKVAQLPRRRILLRHVLPNIAAPLVVQAFLSYGGIFVLLTALSFLSLGFNPEEPSWGQLTSDASANISQHPWMMIPIGIALVGTILAINTIGNALLRALPSQSPGEQGPGEGRALRPGPRAVSAIADAVPEAEPVLAAEDDPADALLRLENVGVSIAGVNDDAPLVRDVSLGIRRGRTLALVGESGSGKTLTALSVVKLLPAGARVSAGRVLFDGVDVAAWSERQFRALRGTRIGFVSQDPSLALDPCFTVRFQLCQALRHQHRMSRAAAAARAAELLASVGIARVDDVLRSFPHQLSGGMVQRVAIALAITGEPDLLVADEPTTALDVTVQAGILELLADLQVRLGLTILLVTHDMGVVAEMADTVAVMHHGRIVENGPVEQVLTEPRHPYTLELLRAARRRQRRLSESPS